MAVSCQARAEWGDDRCPGERSTGGPSALLRCWADTCCQVIVCAGGPHVRREYVTAGKTEAQPPKVPEASCPGLLPADTAQRRSFINLSLGEGEPGLSPLECSPCWVGAMATGAMATGAMATGEVALLWVQNQVCHLGLGVAALGWGWPGLPCREASPHSSIVAGWPQSHGRALGTPGLEARWLSLAPQEFRHQGLPGTALDPWCVHSPERARVRLKKTQPPVLNRTFLAGIEVLLPTNPSSPLFGWRKLGRAQQELALL